jgi:hypothetical protein
MGKVFKRSQKLLIFAGLLAAFPLFARDVDITVEDFELGLPLEGAVIRSWDGEEHVCDEEGKVRISAPGDRPVVIEAAYPGYENGRLVVTPEQNSYTLGLNLSGLVENRELVIEARKPGSNETKTGRSIAVSERDIAITGEIGLIEDVMTTIKLLPGVGYAGFFNATPSIRGGDPGDLSASFNGFYIQNPYHWGGGYSIFDPRMVESAQLSHGVFSARYGHTISGLLEVSSKKPSEETELELGVSSSTANLSLSFPFEKKGGIMLMGRATYYDLFVWAAKKLSKSVPAIDVINSVRVAPYIRSGAFTGNYRFSGDLELSFSGFWGSDGVGITRSSNPNGYRKMDTLFDWTNYQGFISGGLAWNPRSDMLLEVSAGTGYHSAAVKGRIQYDISSLPDTSPGNFRLMDEDRILQTTENLNLQGRLDYDWDLGNGFIFSAGLEELFSHWVITGDYHARLEMTYEDYLEEHFKRYHSYPSLPVTYGSMINYPLNYSLKTTNNIFTTSAFTLFEYGSSDQRFGAELGLRMDHLHVRGEGFSINTIPVFNPRLNLDFGVLKDRGIIENLTVSAGTGLFSSMIDSVSYIEKRYGIKDYELRPARSWTSVTGTKIEFPGNLSLNIEGYYKYIFHRAYVPIDSGPEMDSSDIKAFFNGMGRVWGFDLMIQKLYSRYLDGWISYSFNYARYRDPNGLLSDFSAGNGGLSIGGYGTRGQDWYFPSYHRFHNLNIVINVRPLPQFNISTRLGLASGVLLPVIDRDIEKRTVMFLDSGSIMTKYYRTSHFDDSRRTGISIPLDIKFSIYGFNKKGRVLSEMYIALENALALVYTVKGDPNFNPYTGETDEGNFSASYELPIPMISLGFKWSY